MLIRTPQIETLLLMLLNKMETLESTTFRDDRCLRQLLLSLLSDNKQRLLMSLNTLLLVWFSLEICQQHVTDHEGQSGDFQNDSTETVLLESETCRLMSAQHASKESCSLDSPVSCGLLSEL